MQLVLFIGLQATGKSSYYRHRYVDTHVRLNLDMLRTRHRESVLLQACLTAQQPLVVDNTNPTRADRARYIAAARAAGFAVTGYFFESRLDDALRRNAARTEPQRIPEAGLRDVSRRLELPSRDEGFDALHFVRLLEDRRDFHVEDWR